MGHPLVTCGKINSIGLDVSGAERNIPTVFLEPCEAGMREELRRAIIADGFSVFMEFGCGTVRE